MIVQWRMAKRYLLRIVARCSLYLCSLSRTEPNLIAMTSGSGNSVTPLSPWWRCQDPSLGHVMQAAAVLDGACLIRT